MQPWPTPSFPAEALALPGTHHVAPDLLFHPVLNAAEALTGVAHRHVLKILWGIGLVIAVTNAVEKTALRSFPHV